VKTQKIALVTGGGTGIGKATSLKLSEDGYLVIAAGLDNDDLKETESFIWRELDISNEQERKELFNEIEERFGRIDVLVNNAAISGLKAASPAMDMSLDFLQNMINVNLVSAFACAQSAARLMKKNDSGVIVNISSVAGRAAQVNATAYCVSKAALDSMTRSLAFEWAEYGIRVVGVAPGDIKTNRSDQTKAEENPSPYARKTPLGRAGTAEEVAKTVAFLAGPDASFTTGDTVRVDGGFLSY